MSSKAKRDAANVASARQSTSGSARGVKTAGGTKVKIHDVWTSRILVTTLSGATLYLAW